MSLILNYSLPKRRRWPARLMFFSTGVSVAVSLLFATSVPVISSTSEFDSISGSMRYYVHWPLGFTTQTSHASHISKRLKAMRHEWSPKWVEAGSQSRNFYGAVIERGCGTIPSAARFDRWFSHFIDSASDEELLAIVTVFEVGTQAEQEKLIDDTIELFMKKYDK